jgi:CHAT domain-containing protein/Tfp pilus assembly protein PilF
VTRILILIVSSGSLLFVPISSRVHAQTADPLAEVKRSRDQCVEFYNAGKYDDAVRTCERALTISQASLRSDWDVVTALSNLGAVYLAKGEYAKAEPLYLRALAIVEHLRPADPPLVATVVHNLAELHRLKGEYDEAETLFKRALELREKSLPSEDPLVAASANSLATVYFERGDYTKAEPLYQRALAIYEKRFGDRHPAVIPPLNNLAELYRTEMKYAEAEPLYERALTIAEQSLPSEHPLVASTLHNLALFYSEKGDYKRAEPLLQRALGISEKVLGGDHPEVAKSLSGLASLYEAEDEYAKAEPLLKRVVSIYEKSLGTQHPLVAISLNNLGRLYTAKEDYAQAIDFLSRGQETRELNISALLITGSETEKQQYLHTLVGETDGIVSLHAQSAPANVEAARLALTAILRRKGRALDVMTDQIASLRRRATTDDIKLLDALASAQAQLANFQLANDPRLSVNERRARFAQLETEIERLQGDIGRRSAEFHALTESVTFDAVRAALPADTALVEMFAYRPYNATAKTVGAYYGRARYIAYVLKPQWDAPQFADLGEVAQVDADLKLWRAALLDPSHSDVNQLGRQVDERVMRPVRKLLGDTKRLFISPDGAVNLIPFAALVDENNKYLLESYSLDYLTSGRDLLRLQVHNENSSNPVVLANPTYNLTNRFIAACERQKDSRGLSLDTAGPGAEGDISSRGTDFTQLCYTSLKGTAQEAMQIKAVLTNATVLTDRQATEAAIKQLNAPSILHIATHGFFWPDQPLNLNNSVAQNPLLRSGLIMAGVNQKSSGPGEDGVLTAAEVAGLNLWGTKLVTLSACETALGDVVNGAGVYGLRRALVLAGSETQVMSLWQVDDEATRDLMSDYYTRLQHGEGRAEAMRQVQLAMLRGEKRGRTSRTRQLTRVTTKNVRRTHPYYWASFISSGDWRKIDE